MKEIYLYKKWLQSPNLSLKNKKTLWHITQFSGIIL